MAWSGSEHYGKKPAHVEKQMGLLRSGNYWDESFSKIDLVIQKALSDVFDMGYSSGVLDRTADVEAELRRQTPREGLIFVGDTILLSNGNSRLYGTFMEGAIISTPAMSGTFEDFADRGWKVQFVVSPASEGVRTDV